MCDWCAVHNSTDFQRIDAIHAVEDPTVRLGTGKPKKPKKKRQDGLDVQLFPTLDY